MITRNDAFDKFPRSVIEKIDYAYTLTDPRTGGVLLPGMQEWVGGEALSAGRVPLRP